MAVEPPRVVQEELYESLTALRQRWQFVRWEDPHKLHVTLKFLGQVHAEQEQPITDALTRVTTGTMPFPAELAGAGAYPTPRRARVLWVGFGSGSEKMVTLQRLVEGALSVIGFAEERRRFSAHLTVGRIKRPMEPLDLSAVEVPRLLFQIEQVCLKRSRLTPKGSIYTDVASFPLGRPPGRSSK